MGGNDGGNPHKRTYGKMEGMHTHPDAGSIPALIPDPGQGFHASFAAGMRDGLQLLAPVHTQMLLAHLRSMVISHTEPLRMSAQLYANGADNVRKTVDGWKAAHDAIYHIFQQLHSCGLTQQFSSNLRDAFFKLLPDEQAYVLEILHDVSCKTSSNTVWHVVLICLLEAKGMAKQAALQFEKVAELLTKSGISCNVKLTKVEDITALLSEEALGSQSPIETNPLIAILEKFKQLDRQQNYNVLCHDLMQLLENDDFEQNLVQSLAVVGADKVAKQYILLNMHAKMSSHVASARWHRIMLTAFCSYQAYRDAETHYIVLQSINGSDHTYTAQFHTDAGIMKMMLNKTDEAIKEFEKAVNVDDQYFEAHLYLAYLFYKQGKTMLAIAACKIALKCHCDKVIAFLPGKRVFSDQFFDMLEEMLPSDTHTFSALHLIYYVLIVSYDKQAYVSNAIISNRRHLPVLRATLIDFAQTWSDQRYLLFKQALLQRLTPPFKSKNGETPLLRQLQTMAESKAFNPATQVIESSWYFQLNDDQVNLNEKARSHGFGYPENVEGQGDCLFIAILKQIIPDIEDDTILEAVEVFRGQVCDFMEHVDNRQYFEQYLIGDFPDDHEYDFSNCIAAMRTMGTWGGHTVLTAISAMCKAHVYLVDSQHDTPLIIRQPNAAQTLYLGRVNANHYQRLRPIHSQSEHALAKIIAKESFDHIGVAIADAAANTAGAAQTPSYS